MGKIKVLLCSPMDEGEVGGITKWTKYIVNYANSQDMDIELEQYYPPTSDSTSIKTVFHRIWRGLKSYVPLLVGLKKRLQVGKYDIVHFSTSASLSLIRDFLTIKIAHKYGVKTVVHFHFGRIPQIYDTRNWEYLLMNKVMKITDMAIAMDMASYKTLQSAGYKNVALVPNPLSSSVVNLIEKNKDIRRNPRILMFAGHVIPTKGIHELIAACKGIDNVKLELYGTITQEMRDALISEAGDNYEKWFDIKGECSLEKIITAMLSAGVFVLPTYTEGFPNVIIESMACGCPIVTTPVGAIPEMLDMGGDEECGICVPVRDVVALKKAIEQILNNPGLADEYAKKAHERVNRLYNISAVWTNLEEVWKACTK